MTRYAARILRFRPSNPPRMTGPEVASYLRSDAEIEEEARREALAKEASDAMSGALLVLAILFLAWWIN